MMKAAIASFVCGVALMQVRTADEPLLSAALNNILPKIKTGLTIREVEMVLSTAYPGVKGRPGRRAGKNGYIDYELNEQYTLSVLSTPREGDKKILVHEAIQILISDSTFKRHIELKLNDWGKEAEQIPPAK
jgi:hypothetical protein